MENEGNERKGLKMESLNGKQIADTILQQLGGNKFITMTGAKDLAFDKDGSLTFKIGRNCASINAVKVELNGSDLYKMTFMRIRKMNVSIVDQKDDVFCEQLQSIFTEVTGMDTSL